MKSNFDIDMSKELSIQNNIKKSKIITLGSCAIGALLFFVAYGVTNNVWFVALALILVGTGIFFIVVVAAFEKKYAHIINPDLKQEEEKMENIN